MQHTGTQKPSLITSNFLIQFKQENGGTKQEKTGSQIATGLSSQPTLN